MKSESFNEVPRCSFFQVGEDEKFHLDERASRLRRFSSRCQRVAETVMLSTFYGSTAGTPNMLAAIPGSNRFVFRTQYVRFGYRILVDGIALVGRAIPSCGSGRAHSCPGVAQ